MKTFLCGIPCPTRIHATRCGNTVFYFRVRPGAGTWQESAPTVQPPLKSPQTLATAIFFIHLSIAIAVLAKLLIVGLAGTGDCSYLS
jgi:hypothetical protein